MTSWNLEFSKWDGAPHWHFELTRLGQDEHGQWFGADAGTPLQRGAEPPIDWECEFLILVPPAGDHVATFNASGKYPIYVDVTGPVTMSERVIRAVDLDLDVVRTAAGAVMLLDEEEFLAHQRLYGYPPEVVTAAEATAARLMRQVRAGDEPFSHAAEPWFAALRVSAADPGGGVGGQPGAGPSPVQR
ncbi:MAG: hypothetical protein JWO63_167 [Frankiales bacterium]|nr:hypothetical protein [Frankiales bacterium]